MHSSPAQGHGMILGTQDSRVYHHQQKEKQNTDHNNKKRKIYLFGKCFSRRIVWAVPWNSLI